MHPLELYVQMHNQFIKTRNNAYIEAMSMAHALLDEQAQKILPNIVPFYTEINMKEAQNLVDYGLTQAGLYNQLLLKARDITSNHDLLVRHELKKQETSLQARFEERAKMEKQIADENVAFTRRITTERIKDLNWWRRLWKLF